MYQLERAHMVYIHLQHLHYNSASSSRPSKHADSKRTYRLVNVETGAYVALLSDTDGLGLINMTPNLEDEQNRGSEVEISLVRILLRQNLPMLQWFVTHLRRDEYKLQNSHFKSFAVYANRPQAGNQILAKRDKPVAWIIRRTEDQNLT